MHKHHIIYRKTQPHKRIFHASLLEKPLLARILKIFGPHSKRLEQLVNRNRKFYLIIQIKMQAHKPKSSCHFHVDLTQVRKDLGL